MSTSPQNKSMHQQESETALSRGEFIRSLGMSSAALMAFYCMGTLSSCSSKKDDPAPVVITPGGPTTGGGSNGVTGNANTGSGAIDFTVDLTNANFTSLKTMGGFVNVGEIIVFNAAGTYKALGRICTHASGNLSFRSASNDLICDVHGGLFNTDGSVKQSPPTTAVKAYSAVLSGDKLQVKA